jgi:hypothetical protein
MQSEADLAVRDDVKQYLSLSPHRSTGAEQE